MTSRKETLLKLLASQALYRDEIFSIMGGTPESVDAALDELAIEGRITIPVGRTSFKRLYTVRQDACAEAIGAQEIRPQRQEFRLDHWLHGN